MINDPENDFDQYTQVADLDIRQSLIVHFLDLLFLLFHFFTELNAATK